MEHYDLAWGAPPAESLTLDQRECIGLSDNYRPRHEIPIPRACMHGMVRSIVEDQLAQRDRIVVATFARLRREGFDRDDAIQTIAFIFCGRSTSRGRSRRGQQWANERHCEALRKLSSRMSTVS
jgi:hypothetical protein